MTCGIKPDKILHPLPLIQRLEAAEFGVPPFFAPAKNFGAQHDNLYICPPLFKWQDATRNQESSPIAPRWVTKTGRQLPSGIYLIYPSLRPPLILRIKGGNIFLPHLIRPGGYKEAAIKRRSGTRQRGVKKEYNCSHFACFHNRSCVAQAETINRSKE